MQVTFCCPFCREVCEVIEMHICPSEKKRFDAKKRVYEADGSNMIVCTLECGHEIALFNMGGAYAEKPSFKDIQKQWK